MPSNDARTLLHTAVPTAAAGVIAAVISGVVAGGKGALGAVVGTLVVIALHGDRHGRAPADGQVSSRSCSRPWG